MSRVLLALSAIMLSCTAESQPTAARASLPAGVAARVGSDLVVAATIARIASAQGIDRAQARDLAIKDALFAAAVRANPERAASVLVAERATLGRALLASLEQQARDSGPPTDAEVTQLSAERWTEFDRPVSVRTVHAVVLVKKPENAAPARALAERLAVALQGITDSAEFLERARAFPVAPLELTSERLSPVTTDGRMWDVGAPPGTQFPNIDLDYARAANALEHAGEQSPVVKTAFGYHVILLVERIPEERSSREARRERLQGDIVSRRAKTLLEGTMTHLRNGAPVEVVRAADSLTALVAGGQ